MAKKKTAKKATKKTTKKGAKKTTQKAPSKKKVSSKKTETTNENVNITNINMPKAPKKEESKGKVGVLIALAIIIIIAAIFAITAYHPLGTEEVPESVATANDLAITITETSNSISIDVTSTGDSIYVTESEIEYLTELFKTNNLEPSQSEVIQEAVVRNVLLSNAQGIEADSRVIESLASNQAFVERVEANGFEVQEFIDKFRTELEKDLIIQEYFNQEIVNKVPGQEAFETSHILICYEGAQLCQENRTKEEARNVAAGILSDLKRVNTEEYFAEKARTSSDGPSSVNGGYLGPVTPGLMVKEFEEATFALEAGEISELVETNFGYHIIRVNEIVKTPNQQVVVEKLTELRQKIVQNAQTTLTE